MQSVDGFEETHNLRSSFITYERERKREIFLFLRHIERVLKLGCDFSTVGARRTPVLELGFRATFREIVVHSRFPSRHCL